MTKKTGNSKYVSINSVAELGNLIRAFRKSHKITLEKVSGLSKLSMRFLSELERGKETAELGKTLKTINILGLELTIQPRGTQKKLLQNSTKNI